MNKFNKIPNRSDVYQNLILEIAYPHELLDIFSDHDSIYKRLNPFAYNDDIAELEEELKQELWRIIEEHLTDRQKQVVKLYASGKTQIEIAKVLGVNQSSVTKCLAPETLVYFVANKMAIGDIWQTWQHTSNEIKQMNIFCVNENTRKLTKTHIKNVMQNEEKELLSITTSSNYKIRATQDHKFFTADGWVPLQDIVDNQLELAVHVSGGIKFENIISCIKNSKEITYDIEVMGPYHNFIANNVIVHNCLNGNVDYKNKDSKGRPTAYGGVKIKLQKIAKEDKKVNDILQKIADIRDSDLF